MFEYLAIPLSLLLLLLILALPLITIYLFIRLTEEAFERVGFGHWHATLMVFGSVIGSLVDIPINEAPISSYPQGLLEATKALSITFPVDFHPVLLAVNLGGCIIPVLISLEILLKRRASTRRALLGIAVIALITYAAAMPVPREGIVLPVYLPPMLAALVGVVLAKRYRSAPALAYVSGTMGTLIGADLMTLLTPGVLSTLSPPGSYELPLVLSIGGAGVFDGIFLTGVLAVLLAAVVVCIFNRSCKK